MDDAPPSYGMLDEDPFAGTTHADPVVSNPQSQQPQPTQQPPQPQQQVVYVQQPPQQQQVVYVNQYGQPIQPQQQVVQVQPQTAAIIAHAHPTQQAVELQVASNAEIQKEEYASPHNDDEYATLSNKYENVQKDDEHGYIYDDQPADEKHEWVNEDELPPPGYDDVAPKEGLGCVQGCKETPHFKAWFCTILVFFPFVCYFICLSALTSQCYCEDFFSDETTNDKASLDTCDSYDLHCDFPCAMTYAIGGGFWGIVAGVYLLYIIEATCCSSSFKYLKNTMEGETVYQWVAKIKQNAPRIWWKVECYHYETRIEHYTDSDGNHKTRTRREKVVTHRASMDYAYNSWCDISKDVTGLDEYNLTKFSAYKQFSFADSATQNDYNMKSAQFRRNNDRDQYQSFYYGVEVQGYKSKMLFEVKPGTKSSAISLSCYMISSFLLCSVCYRMYFAAVCGRKSFVFDKQVKMAQVQVQQAIIIQPQQNVVIIQPQPQNVVVVQQ